MSDEQPRRLDITPEEGLADDDETEASNNLTRSEIIAQAREALEEMGGDEDPSPEKKFMLLMFKLYEQDGELAAAVVSKKKVKKEKKLKSMPEEKQDEAIAQAGKRGFLSNLRRQFASTGRAMLTLGGKRGKDEYKQRAIEHREVSVILKRALKTISSETDLRNSIDEIMREGSGVMGIKNHNKRKDILALALFLKNEGLVGDYNEKLNVAGFWEEENMDEIVEREIKGQAELLKGLYDKDGENGDFHNYIQRQSRFFAKVFGSEVVIAVPAEEDAEKDVEVTPDAAPAEEEAAENDVKADSLSDIKPVE